MRKKLLQLWFVVGLLILAGTVTALAEPMGMMASSSGDKAVYEMDWLWGTGIAMWGVIAVGIYKGGP